jgi:hypothetical protein
LSQSSQIPNSEGGRERPSGARKILRKKKFALPEEDINTLILFHSGYVAVQFLRKISKI